MKTIAIVLALLPIQLTAHAQDIWRCGADGRSYGSAPCSEGRLVAAGDSRPAADVRAAQARAVREAALADRLQRDRQQQQARALGNGLGSLSAGQRATPVKPVAKPATKEKRKRQMHPSAAAGTSPAAAAASRRTTD